MNGDFRDTMMFRIKKETSDTPKSILLNVYRALQEKGYDPVNQFVGYFISGDPTYITNHRNARSIIGRLERDELLGELVSFYIENQKESGN
jgi:uncharacterized protein (UPF0297 family)